MLSLQVCLQAHVALMKHTVCQVPTLKHAKCKYVLYDYHILMQLILYNMLHITLQFQFSQIWWRCYICTWKYNYLNVKMQLYTLCKLTFQLSLLWWSAIYAKWALAESWQWAGSTSWACWNMQNPYIVNVCGNIERSYQTYTCSQTRCRDCLRDTGKFWILHNMDQFNCIML